MVPLQPAGTAARALDKALSTVQPKAGRAPIFATLEAALSATGEPKDASISAVVVSGTGDDCIAAMCEGAKALHSTYPNAKLSVLGVGMSELPAANFTCAAKAMGGEFTAVKSATDLSRLLRQAFGVSPDGKPAKHSTAEATPPEPGNPQGAGKKQAAAPTAQTVPATQAAVAAQAAPAGQAAPGAQAAPAAPIPADTKPATPPAPQAEPNTTLSATLADGQPPLDAGVTWEIYKITTTPTGQQKTADSPSWVGGGGKARLKLGEGRYLVRAAYGLASAQDSIAVNGGKVEKTVALNAGTIAAEGLQTQGAGAARGVLFTLSRRKQGGGMEELGRSSESPAAFHVNAGEYVLSASAGPAGLASTVKAEAGKVSVVRMALNVGTLEIKTYEVEGAANTVSAWHRVYPAAESAKKPLATVEGAAPRVQLPAGDYRLETIYGNARVESAVSVAAGQIAARTVILSAGRAKISVPSGKQAKVCAAYEEGADRSAGPAGRAAGTAMSFILRAGVYGVECRAQGAAAPGKPVEIRVVAGETKETKLQE